VHPSGLWATDDVEHVQVFGARSRDELARVAPQVFREKGLGEVTCRFETRDMASLGGDNSDPDLLELRAGSVVEVQVARIEPGGTVGTRQAFQGMGEPDLVRLLVERHEMDRKAAGALARALTGGASAALRTWYVREVEHAWDAETGYSCRVEAVNSPQVRVVEGSHA
jgi:hypothetical protein